MKVQEVDSFLNPLLSDLYGFAFVLCLDEFQAKKICKDALYLFYQKEEGFCLQIAERSGSEDQPALRFQALLFLMKWCVRSFLALPVQKSRSNCFTYFSELDFLTRGLLYCRHKKSFSYEDCETVFEEPAHKLMMEIARGRDFLLQGQGTL